ncbi:hypothetical protein POM88_003183 [Heracleum sosnowskyi]|uniref:At2g29880-like C-terminal domain-containing protein n=1 Tax=Heracleum sosnowskyi TaxID=360622 RepID=A0AAD8ND90_9APIA|nr:hypothetical protein POM88_003183 [Heracleum sosnowskyi]
MADSQSSLELSIDDSSFDGESEGSVLPNKKSRLEYEENSNSSENTLESEILVQLAKLTTMLENLYEMLKERKQERTYTSWDAIKEVPNLDEDVRLEAFNLLDTKPKIDGFLKMTLEERAKWILMTTSKK